MIVADFQVYDNATNPIIKHYFVSHLPGMFKKLCLATGLDYDSGNIEASALKGLECKVLMKIQKDTTGQYSDKNVIAAFAKEFPADAQKPAPVDMTRASQAPEVMDDDDDTPF